MASIPNHDRPPRRRRIAALSLIATALTAPAGAAPGPAPAAGDPTAGQAVFHRCAGCHATAPGENRIGPSLAGVVGRKDASVPGYAYSPALKQAGLVWDEATLDRYLASPTATVHGTKMFASLGNPEDRRNVIAYLKTLAP